MSKQQYIKIDSGDRDSGSCYDYVINTAFNILGSYRLASVYLPNTAPNIGTYNSHFALFENSVLTAITVSTGYYSPDNICSVLRAALNAASGGYNTYTVTYDEVANKLLFNAGNTFQLIFAGVTNSIGPVLGFGSSNSTAGTQVISTVPCDFNPIKSYNITINNNNQNILDVKSGRWYSLHIQPTINTNNVQTYEPTTAFPQYVQLDSNRISVQVYDDAGNNVKR
jgi:hypothetical protein